MTSTTRASRDWEEGNASPASKKKDEKRQLTPIMTLSNTFIVLKFAFVFDYVCTFADPT